MAGSWREAGGSVESRWRRVGVMGGLGANGALWAPWLARQWVAWLTSGAAFDHAVDVNRLPEKAERAPGKQ